MTAPPYGLPWPALTARVLAIVTDAEAASTLAAALVGREVVVRGTWPAELAGPWDVVLAEEGVSGASPRELATRAAAVGADFLWVTRAPRGDAARAALEAGAADVLALPLWGPEVAARVLGRAEAARRQRDAEASYGEGAEAQLAAYAAQLVASQENLRELYEELEATSRDLQRLATAQEGLIPVQVPDQIRTRAEAALRSFFPGATVAVDLGAPGSEGPQRAVWGASGRDWTRAVVPLALEKETAGSLEVSAPDGQAYSPRRLDLLDVYAAQAAQALHRSRLHEALSLGKAEWERTFDTISDAISIIGPDFTIRRANWALARTLGKTPQHLIGRRCYAILYDRQEPCAGCPVAEALGTGREARTEQPVTRGARVYDYRAYPLRDEQGRVYAAIAYARDVSREEVLAQGLGQSEKLMNLGQLAAGIAHEINNPLTAVSSYAQLLALRLTDPKGAESARRIQQGVERIHRLVQNLVSFAHPSDDSLGPVDLNEVVAAALTFVRYEVTRGNTRLEERLQVPLPRVLGAPDQLEQLVVSLLTNARDAVAGRGSVRLVTRSEGGQVFLEVIDDGLGILPQDLARIFEPFFTTKPVGKGTGLGLFVAAGIARKHGGELAVESAPGRGTRATLRLPAFAPGEPHG